MYQQLLQEHMDGKKAYGVSPQPPATAAQLQALRDSASQELGVELPKEYYELLEKVNGLDSNGMAIYGSETACIVGYDDRFIQGLVEANLIWRDLEWHKEFVFFGDSGISLYALELKSGKYQLQDRRSGSVVKEFDTFGALLRKGLEENRP